MAQDVFRWSLVMKGLIRFLASPMGILMEMVPLVQVDVNLLSLSATLCNCRNLQLC
jgi:hypothetical protein